MSSDVEAIRRFHGAIAGGKQWYVALLEAIGQWQSEEEILGGRRYRYLIDGEAFDWLLLAERLLEAVDGLIPEEERSALLLHNRPPTDITADAFKKYLGDARYPQYLNYFYGVTVERALALAVQEEIRKERHVAGYLKERENSEDSFRRIYGEEEAVLLARFQKERRYRRVKSISLGELKEFTYWLFKYRVKHSDRARVASDTRKALDWLQRHGQSQRLFKGHPGAIIDT